MLPSAEGEVRETLAWVMRGAEARCLTPAARAHCAKKKYATQYYVVRIDLFQPRVTNVLALEPLKARGRRADLQLSKRYVAGHGNM